MVNLTGPQKKTGLVAMTERDFQKKVVDLCNYLGLFVYHTYDSRRSQAGFPDLVIVGQGTYTIFAELKSDTGKVSNVQHEWILRLKSTGMNAFVWRPADWPGIESVLFKCAGK